MDARLLKHTKQLLTLTGGRISIHVLIERTIDSQSVGCWMLDVVSLVRDRDRDRYSTCDPQLVENVDR